MKEKNKQYKQQWLVLKFGGTSVSSLACWQKIRDIIKRRFKEFPDSKLVIVCSAISQISNRLEKIIETAISGDYGDQLIEIKGKHQNLCQELNVDFEQVIGNKFQELERLLTGLALVRDIGPRLHARILSYGEILLTLIVQEYLASENISTAWVDARQCLRTKDNQFENNEFRQYLSAVCEYDFDEDLAGTLAEKNTQVIITQGFIASNSKDQTVLLGRGGSDVSGSYFAAKLKALRLEIWTDVPGVFTADPRTVGHARLLKLLSYDEAQEIMSAGAKVLHPRCIHPVQQANIPLYILCTHFPQMEGTIITNEIKSFEPKLKAISQKKEVTLISMDTIGMWHQVGFLADVFTCFKKRGLSINLVSTSETNITVTLDDKLNTLAPEILKDLQNDLEKFCHLKIKVNCAAVGLIGRNIRAILHKLTPGLELFEEQKIYLLSQSSSDLNLTCVVDEDQADRLVKRLHGTLLDGIGRSETFGPTWNELFEDNLPEEPSSLHYWWESKRSKLIHMAKEIKAPLYVYHLETVRNCIKQLQKLTAIDQLFYAMKANHHSWILALLENQGLGFECVSKEELEYLFQLFPHINPQRILFTPNFAPREEYQLAFSKGVNVTLDSIYPLEVWPEVFQGKSIIVRVDPGKGRGHHKYVHTGGNESKFGITPNSLNKLAELAERYQVNIVGLHAHSGSGIRYSNNWAEMALFLVSVADLLPKVTVLNLGGGLGVPEKAGQDALNIEKLEESLQRVKNSYPKFKLWLEPGRYLVASSGVLLSQVTQVKTKGSVNYVGLNTGMNSLIRPALYGSYHEIVNLSKLTSPKSIVADVVGPICETGDILGHARHLPQTAGGDIILIDTVGAYGSVMGSKYTMRTPAREMILD